MGEKIFLFGNEPELKLFYTDIFGLYSQMQSLERSLEISDKPVIIVQDFSPSMFEERSAFYYVVRLGLAMAFLGLIIAMVLPFRKTIWDLVLDKNTEINGTSV
jgi:hypothetical protein